MWADTKRPKPVLTPYVCSPRTPSTSSRAARMRSASRVRELRRRPFDSDLPHVGEGEVLARQDGRAGHSASLEASTFSSTRDASTSGTIGARGGRGVEAARRERGRRARPPRTSTPRAAGFRRTRSTTSWRGARSTSTTFISPGPAPPPAGAGRSPARRASHRSTRGPRARPLARPPTSSVASIEVVGDERPVAPRRAPRPSAGRFGTGPRPARARPTRRAVAARRDHRDGRTPAGVRLRSLRSGRPAGRARRRCARARTRATETARGRSPAQRHDRNDVGHADPRMDALVLAQVDRARRQRASPARSDSTRPFAAPPRA